MADFCNVGYVLPLLNFELIIHCLPVIGNCKDAVGALKGLLEGGFVIDVALLNHKH